MGDIVDLKPVSLIENHELISDMCRFSENILSENAIRKKYRMFDDTVWQQAGDECKIMLEQLRAFWRLARHCDFFAFHNKRVALKNAEAHLFYVIHKQRIGEPEFVVC
jgi:hypothetical protein